MELLLNHKTLKNLVITLIAILVLFTAVKTISEYKSMKYIGTGINPTNTIT